MKILKKIFGKLLFTIVTLITFLLGFAALVCLLVVFLLADDSKFEFEDMKLVYLIGSLIVVMLVFLFLLIFRSIVNLANTYNIPDEIESEIDDAEGLVIVGVNDGGDNSNSKKKVKINSKDRYQNLSILDQEHPDYEKVNTSKGMTLEKLCYLFRDYACKELKLYYSIEDIRRFIASMGVSKILILQGMSGTGKTSLPVAFGRFIQHGATVIPVQPMWKERSDLLGYFNEFTGKFNETMILEKLYEANQSDDISMIVLDELNIARVEYYFSEFLSLLELPQSSSRVLEVTSTISKDDPKLLNNGKLQLSDNVWFIGTANNDDSTFAISDKVYDRSMILNLDYRCDPFTVSRDCQPVTVAASDFLKMIETAKQEYTLTIREKRHIKELDKYVSKNFNITFGNRIMRQIEAYVAIFIACGGTELEALDDILSKKLLRKLESQNPIYVKSHADELIAKFNEIFGQDSMPMCEAYIERIVRNG